MAPNAQCIIRGEMLAESENCMYDTFPNTFASLVHDISALSSKNICP